MRLSSLTDWCISFLFGVVVWMFFAIFYRHHLHYQEQIQLFLFTADYFMELIARPGGLAIYLGRFFTQFFYDSFLGAFSLALLLVILQRLVSDAANYISHKPTYRLITYIPSLAFALLLCNEDMLLSGLVAVILSMLFILCCNRIRNDKVQFLFIILMLPILYWLVGFASCIFLIYSILMIWVCKKGKNRVKMLTITIIAILIWIACPYIAKEIVSFYPVSRFWFAGDYYRYVVQLPLIIPFYFLFVALFPFLFKFMPEIKSKSGRLSIVFIQIGLLLFITVWGVIKVADWDKEEIMAYSYYARTQKWNSIIALADKKSPDGPLTVSTLNMALSKKDYLREYMFTYYQNGTEGLLPDSRRDYNVLTMTGEIYYHLGLINTAQHFTFEAMEAIPDYQKSVRCIKRLAETNLINGQYEVAAKYLEILKQTLFYRKWAIETSGYLRNEERINNHPEWGKLRSFKPEEDFLFSDREKDMMLGLLFQRNPANSMAYEYLLAYTLLVKDLPRFTDYLKMNGQSLQELSVSRSYQEALALIWSRSEYNPALKPPFSDNTVVKKLESYRNIYTSNAVAEEILKQQYGDTYWYYFHFRSK